MDKTMHFIKSEHQTLCGIKVDINLNIFKTTVYYTVIEEYVTCSKCKTLITFIPKRRLKHD